MNSRRSRKTEVATMELLEQIRSLDCKADSLRYSLEMDRDDLYGELESAFNPLLVQRLTETKQMLRVIEAVCTILDLGLEEIPRK